MFLIGVALMGIGLIYIWKPNLFRRGIWLKTSVAIRLLSEENYIKYIKGVGAVWIVIGLSLVFWSVFGHMRMR
jgi:hypothetical protein